MKFLPSLTGTMSGSIGGITASHNRAGMYFRNRVVPTNPNTTRQQSVRTNFSSCVNYWANTLTAAQRLAWETFAANTPQTDVLGQSFFLTGQQAFIKANTLRLQATQAIIAAGPTTYNNGSPPTGIATSSGSVAGSLGVIAGTSAFSIDVLCAGGATGGGQLALWLGPDVSPGTNFYKGSYQLAAFTSIADTEETTSFSTALALQLNASPLVAGQRRPARLRIVYNDGRMSDNYSIIAPVVDDT